MTAFQRSEKAGGTICTPNAFGVHIFMRKKGTKNKNYSAEFKISVIMNVRRNIMSLRGICAEDLSAAQCFPEEGYFE